MARSTSGSSSTVNKIGFAMVALRLAEGVWNAHPQYAGYIHEPAFGRTIMLWAQPLGSSPDFTGLDFVHITPDPRLPRLIGTDQRVLRFVEMFGRVLVLRRVTTTHM